jgi:hypothetical protein
MITIDLDLDDLSVAHTAIAGAIIATEAVIAELSTHANVLPSDAFDQLVFSGRHRVDALRRVSDALFDAELQLRFPQ